MADKKPEVLGSTGKIRFDVTKEFRIGGNGATYVVKNYTNAVNHPEFQQAIEMGTAYGYHGHPRRQVLENGKLIWKHVLFPHEDEATPAHVCRYCVMDGNFCIHEEDFLDTTPGVDVWGLWKGKTGGFSSRASTIGGYGGKFYPTKLARMAGFDFVHDRSYRYNSFEGIIATESTGLPELTVEYLRDECGISDKRAHFICNGGVCPRPEDLALEQALFLQTMENEIALENQIRDELNCAHQSGLIEAYKKGRGESVDEVQKEFNDNLEKFKASFEQDQGKLRKQAEQIAIEAVRKLPRKPYLPDDYYTAIAPALIEAGTDEAAIESAFFKIIEPFTGYNPGDFAEPEDEHVNILPEPEARPFPVRPEDRNFVRRED